MLQVITPATSHDLTVLETARAELGGAAGATDADILGLIGQASAACAAWCNRPTFAKETVRQTERGAPPAGIILARDLNVQVQGVTVSGVALTSDEYAAEDGVLFRIGAGMCFGWQWGLPVVIEYTAGFSLLAELPHDIERACLATLRAWYFARGRDPGLRSMSSEGIGMTQFAPAAAGGLPPEAAALLQPWRRPPGF